MDQGGGRGLLPTCRQGGPTNASTPSTGQRERQVCGILGQFPVGRSRCAGNEVPPVPVTDPLSPRGLLPFLPSTVFKADISGAVIQDTSESLIIYFINQVTSFMDKGN